LIFSFKESETSVLNDLRWLGLHWDEGPDMDAKYGPYRQSERNDIYLKLANKLQESGQAYKCFCSPEELEEMKIQQEAQGIPPRYDGRWRDADPALVQEKLDQGIPYTVRFKVPMGSRVVIDDIVRGTVSWDADSTVGDFILLRSSGVPVYNFCVAVDDAMMGISTVIRAEEHLTNTLRQGLILDALGAPRPRYAHCSLILGEDKQKLSKRHGATSCDQFRLDGFLPDAMINYLALLGWNDGTDNEIFSRDELIEIFDLNRVVKSPSVFDMEKLKWVNSQHMKMMEVESLVPLVRDQLLWENCIVEGTLAEDSQLNELAFAVTSLAKQMMETTKDAVLNAKMVLGYGLPTSFSELSDQEAISMIKLGHFYPLISKVLELIESNEFPMPDPQRALSAFTDKSGKGIREDNQPGGGTFDYTEAYKVVMKVLAKEMGLKGKSLFHPIRLALTGEMSGQDVTKQLSLLAMASRDDCVIDREKVQIVTFEERIERLKVFLESIPEEFRISDKNKISTKESGASMSGQAPSTSDSPPTSASVATPSIVLDDPKNSYDGPPISALDIRVGRILKVWEHEEAEKLYCEEIDVGEDSPRLIASGLKPYMQRDEIEGRLCLVLCNLKERKLVGFPSHGMVLCASNTDHSVVKFVSPPVDAKVGERVTIPDFNFEGEEGEPFPENKIGKKKVIEALSPYLVTNKYGIPEFLGRPFMTSSGVCTSPIPDGTVG
jgi:glutamyl-tRNA synthetase